MRQFPSLMTGGVSPRIPKLSPATSTPSTSPVSMWKARRKLQRSLVAFAVSPDQVQGQIASQEQDSKYVPARFQAIVATSVIDA